MQPMPLRTSVGTICEMIPPAPIQSALLFEKTSWSKPGIFLCRSSAPGIALPRKLIEVGETVNTGCMIFNSFPIDLDLKVLVQPDEPHIAIAAEDRHQRQMPTAIKPLLEAFIGARGVRGVRASSRMAVKVCQELVAKLLEFDQHVVRRRKIANDSHGSAALVSEFGALIEHENTVNFRAGDEEELLVLVRRQLL